MTTDEYRACLLAAQERVDATVKEVDRYVEKIARFRLPAFHFAVKEPAMTHRRTLTIQISVLDCGDDELLPYIDRWLAIWRARGAPTGEMVEICERRDFSRNPGAVIRGTVTHASSLDK